MPNASIKITINDQPFDIPEGCALEKAISLWPSLPEHFAVAVNTQFVPKSQYGDTNLEEGDAIDLVSPMAGG